MTRQGGFTLLEVLVAFVIAAIALSALLRGGADGLRGVDAASRTMEAVARARSHLEAFDTLAAPTAEDLQGDEGGGYHWRLRVAPLGTVPGSTTALYQVVVVETWQSGLRQASVQLETQRLAPPP